MAECLYPSSYKCDCGHQSDFFERTIWEMEAMSRKGRKSAILYDSAADEHSIEFKKGRATAVICPKLGRCEIS